MTAIELGAFYAVYTPDLSQHFDLNNPLSANQVGLVTDVTGLDSPGVRENAQINVAGDGGYHGPFFRDRRPWTISGVIVPQFPLSSRDAAQEKIEAVMGAAMRGDGILVWYPSDGIQRGINFRQQQPVRISIGQSNADKRFFIAGVSADWRISSGTLKTVTTTQVGSPILLNTTNNGNADAAVYIALNGPMNGPVTITNTTTGKIFTLITAPGFLPSNLYILPVNLIGTYPVITRNDGVNFYGSVDPLNSDWTIAAAPGVNTWSVAFAGGGGAGTAVSISWTDSWL